jgi:transposase
MPGYLNQVINDLLDELSRLDKRIGSYDVMIKEMARQDSRSKRLMQIKGIAEITASALVAMIGNGHDFKNARQFVAWLGLVPRQFSTGGKPRLGRITKRGDTYLRRLLVMGARSVLLHAATRKDPLSRWALALRERRGYHRACIAIAAKNARVVWALLARPTAPLAE